MSATRNRWRRLSPGQPFQPFEWWSTEAQRSERGAVKSGRIELDRLSIRTRNTCKGSLMLATRYRFARNAYFHFHPMHNLFSLLSALILLGLLMWFLAVPAR